jgi:methylglyoxal reductase
VYGFGRAEEILGQSLGNSGRRAFIAGKCGLVWEQSGQFFFETTHEGRPVRVHRSLSAEAVTLDCERSLLRLKRDCMDLYQIHWPLSPDAMQGAYEGLLRLKEQGKIRGIGICNATAEHLASFERSTGQRYDAVQNRLSLVHRSGSAQTLAYARKHRIPFLAYGALGQGALALRSERSQMGPSSDLRQGGELFGDAWQARISRAWACSGIEESERLVSAFRYPLLLEGVSAVIAGIRNEQQARENARAGESIVEAAALRKRLEDAFRDLDYRGK